LAQKLAWHTKKTKIKFAKNFYCAEIIENFYKKNLRLSSYNEIESEYNRIVDKSEEERKYWTDRNKKRFEKIGKLQMKSEYELIKSKLKSRHTFK